VRPEPFYIWDIRPDLKVFNRLFMSGKLKIRGDVMKGKF